MQSCFEIIKVVFGFHETKVDVETLALQQQVGHVRNKFAAARQKKIPMDILNHFWIQVAVSEVKRPSRNRFGSETVTNL